MADIGVEKVSYTGGEPILHPRLLETVMEVNRYGIRQIVATNGTALRESMQVLKYLEYIKFSFYGCQDVHDSLIGKGDYAGLLGLARELSIEGYIVGANLMLSRLSLGTLKKCLSDCLEAGIRHVLLLTYVPTGKTDVDRIHQMDLSVDTLEWIKSEVCSLVHKFESGIKIHNYAIADFTVILDEQYRLWLTSYRGGSDYFMGDLFDEFIGMPHGHKDKIATVMEGIWRKRLSSEAIVTL